MSAGVRVASFVVALAIVFAGAFGVGRAVGPIGDDAPPPHGTTTHVDDGADPTHGTHQDGGHQG